MWTELGAAAGALAAAGLSARWNWWRPKAQGVPVLMYHKIGDPPPASRLKKLWVPADTLRRQMEQLKIRGYQPVTLRALVEGPAPARPVVITFDDGYQNNLDQAFPVLRTFGFPATLFVVASAVGRDNFWHDPENEARLSMLGWDGLMTLRDAGWDIGSHTLTHPRLLGLPRDAAEREIRDSRRLLAERLGTAPVSFAYPYGNGADDPGLHRLVADAGYKTACSVHQGLARLENRWCLNRLFIRGDDTLWDFHLQLTRGKSRF